jgi:chromosome segregation ATPase
MMFRCKITEKKDRYYYSSNQEDGYTDSKETLLDFLAYDLGINIVSERRHDQSLKRLQEELEKVNNENGNIKDRTKIILGAFEKVKKERDELRIKLEENTPPDSGCKKHYEGAIELLNEDREYKIRERNKLKKRCLALEARCGRLEKERDELKEKLQLIDDEVEKDLILRDIFASGCRIPGEEQDEQENNINLSKECEKESETFKEYKRKSGPELIQVVEVLVNGCTMWHPLKFDLVKREIPSYLIELCNDFNFRGVKLSDGKVWDNKNKRFSKESF